MINNGLGYSDRALNQLEKALEEEDARIMLLKVDPKWNNLRHQKRFVALMQRLNLN